jgi:hypothetical protein
LLIKKNNNNKKHTLNSKKRSTLTTTPWKNSQMAREQNKTTEKKTKTHEISDKTGSEEL